MLDGRHEDPTQFDPVTGPRHGLNMKIRADERVETMVAGGLQRLQLAGVSEAEIPQALKTVEAGVTERGPGAHPLTGPVFIAGAEPGDVLEIRIVAIEFLHLFGVNTFSPGLGIVPEEYPYSYARLLRWAPGSDHVEFAPGVSLKLAPFFGSIGVAPPALSGRISSRPPGSHGGNLDNKDLVVGSTLYLPVHVPGALLSVGDGHAMQADGEVTGTALETSLRGTFELRVRKGQRLRWPRAETPTDYISMGTDEDLKTATTIAVQEMVDFLAATRKLTKHEAYQLVSMAGNVAVTQLVDRPVYGVHVKMPKSIFK